MTIQIIVNLEDRTDDIVLDSIVKEDIINEQRDTLKFQVLKYGTKGFEPVINQEVEMNVDSLKEFAGVITNIKKSIEGGGMVIYNVECVDYSQYLDRKLVLERFDDQTIDYIIDFIVNKYADDFDIVNVDCPIEVKTMLFNRLPVTDCLDKLAKTVNYSWYVDYDKDIHFFERNTNQAPFFLTDINGNYLQNTLKITNDLSQLRNKVFIRGSEERGVNTTEIYVGTSGQMVFPLAHKFAEKPSVEVDGTPLPLGVGIDFLDKEDDFDCFWNYQQKYIRFKVDMDGKEVSIAGIPLFPVIVSFLNGASILQYGIYEFFKEDKSITSREEALRYAQAELEAYKDGVNEGEFQTDKAGLRSGQIITIQSDLLGVDESFLIQKVSFRILAKDKGIWTVKLATMRTVGIIQVLQDLIRFREIREFDPENLLTLLQFSDTFKITDSMTPGDDFVVTSPPYTWEEAGIPEANPIKWNKFTWT